MIIWLTQVLSLIHIFNIKNSTYHTVKEAVEAAQTNFFSAKGTSADANYDNKGATGTNEMCIRDRFMSDYELIMIILEVMTVVIAFGALVALICLGKDK